MNDPNQSGENTAEDASVATVESSFVTIELNKVLSSFSATLGDKLLESKIEKDDLWIRVANSAWKQSAAHAKNQGFDYLVFISGIDWQPNPELGGERTFNIPSSEDDSTESDENEKDSGGDGTSADATGVTKAKADSASEQTDSSAQDQDLSEDSDAEATTGYAGGDSRFQIFARYFDTNRHIGITIKADLEEPDLNVDSIIKVFAGADWHERETWEMYGFNFVGHPGLRHLYLPGEFEGYPLRKDFPLLAREVKPWPGIVDVEPMPPVTDEPPSPAAEKPVPPAADESPSPIAEKATPPAIENATEVGEDK